MPGESTTLLLSFGILVNLAIDILRLSTEKILNKILKKTNR